MQLLTVNQLAEQALTPISLKGWEVESIEDGADHCNYCGTAIRWLFVLRHHHEGRLIVGSECVKSFTDLGDPDAALAMMKGGWTQRRHYFYKRTGGLTYIIGPRKPDENGRKRRGWWTAVAPSISAEWLFLEWYNSRELAVMGVAKDAMRRKRC